MRSCVRALSFFFLVFANTKILVTANSKPENCFEQATLENLIKCWSGFLAKSNSISESDFQSSLASEQQRRDWRQVINDILSSNGTCQGLDVPSSIRDFYQIKKFTDKSDGDNEDFCVLYENSLIGKRFLKGWGIFVVPFLKRKNGLNLHYSAAHPITDGPVELQAAAVFRLTKGSSLLVTGARRNASNVTSSCQPGNYRTDAAHDNRTMFHHALIATQTWQFQSSRARLQSETCTISNCAFIQFHGKSPTTCTSDTIFLSNGYAIPSAYANPNLPINRLKKAWENLAPSNWTARTPADDSKCKLKAATNIFGRLLNGVASGEECRKSAIVENLSGFFIHAEQAMEAREKGGYNVWAKSILAAFKV